MPATFATRVSMSRLMCGPARSIWTSSVPTISAAVSAAIPSHSGWFGTCNHSHAPTTQVTTESPRPMRTPRISRRAGSS